MDCIRWIFTRILSFWQHSKYFFSFLAVNACHLIPNMGGLYRYMKLVNNASNYLLLHIAAISLYIIPTILFQMSDLDIFTPTNFVGNFSKIIVFNNFLFTSLQQTSDDSRTEVRNGKGPHKKPQSKRNNGLLLSFFCLVLSVLIIILFIGIFNILSTEALNRFRNSMKWLKLNYVSICQLRVLFKKYENRRT